MYGIALTESFQALLAGFSGAFQLQSCRNFVILATGPYVSGDPETFAVGADVLLTGP